MKLVAVSVSLPKRVEDRTGHGPARIVETGIFKAPVAGRVRLTRLHVEGDGQSDLVNHGGVDKAAYAYPIEHYALWEAELGRTLPHGQFGENLTVEGLTEDTVHVGDRFRIGGAEVEVTQPRVPCFKLGIRMGSPAFVKRFLHSERSGFYLRVVTEGDVGAGDAIVRTHADSAALSVRDIHRLMFHRGPETDEWRAAVRGAVAIPGLSESWRAELTQLLA